MSRNSWWAIRKKFRNTLPQVVTTSYLASLLDMTEVSARTNIIPSLLKTGIIDKDGKPTDRAVKWRDDLQYPKVCEEIRKEVYPQELLDLASDSSTGRSSLVSWFANHAKVGESAAAKLTAFYLMLLEADPSKGSDTSGSNVNTPKIAKSIKPKSKKAKSPILKAQADNEIKIAPYNSSSESKVSSLSGLEIQKLETTKKVQPSLNINIQIHISSDSSADQIDQIFASMAKHLTDFG